MEARSDILNSKIQDYDIQECLREQFHLIGAIQEEFGCIIALKYIESSDTYIITSVSENLVEKSWFAETSDVKSLLGKDLSHAFESDSLNIIVGLVQRFQSIHSVSAQSIQAKFSQIIPVMCKGAHVKVKDNHICCSVVGTGKMNEYIIEMEEVAPDANIRNPKILHSGNTMNKIRIANSVASVVSTYVDYVMSMCPYYDRGMVYEFLDDDSGEVIYENIRDAEVVPDKFLHLRFPAEDIPPLIRQIYLKNPIRIICNTRGGSSKIVSLDASPLDLTMSALRDTSSHHLQYLHQMGVTGSLGIAIIVDEKLWGLYIFHSYTGSVKPSIDERIMFEMIGSMTSSKISMFQSENAQTLKFEVNCICRSLQTHNQADFRDFFRAYWLPCLNIVSAHAVVAYFPDGSSLAFGDESILPNEHGIETMKSSNINTLVSINMFTEGLNGIGAGILFYRHQLATIAFIRRSKINDVKWGGYNENMKKYLDVPRLHPSSSFRIYAEKAKKESKFWSKTDIDLGNQIIDCLIQCLNNEVLNTYKSELEQSNVECMEVMKAAKENYEFFAHMSHELRTPFHGVISSLQILQSTGNKLNEEDRKEIVDSALDCGKVMLKTLDDILTIAKNKNFVEIVKAPFHISKVMATTKQTLIRMAEVKSIDLKSEILISNLKLDLDKLKEDTSNDSESEISLLTPTIDGEVVISNDLFQRIVVLGDQSRIGQICNNLTNNSIKFTPMGGSVSIKSTLVSSLQDVQLFWDKTKVDFDSSYLYDEKLLADLPSNDLFYVYMVQDSGCGMTKTDLPSIFEAYQQVSSGVTKTYQGTGLGLHIVRLHIQAMKGMIGVASTSGKGTLFLFAIPLTMVDCKDPLIVDNQVLNSTIGENQIKDEEMEEAVSETTNIAKNMSHLNVNDGTEDNNLPIFLLVDDSKINLKLAAQKIDIELGGTIKIMKAEDGLEAIAVYENLVAAGKQHLLCAIFMDYHMPKCSGLQAIQAIRKIEKKEAYLNPCYIVAFTADLNDISKTTLMEGGADEVMAKPTPTRQLENTCVKLLNDHLTNNR